MEKKYLIHNILMLFSLGLLLILHYFILFMEEEKGEGAALFFILLLFSNWGLNAFKEEKNLIQSKIYYILYNLALIILIIFLGYGLISYFLNNHNAHYLRNIIAAGLPYLGFVLTFLALDIAGIFLKKETVIVKKDISNFLYISAALVSLVNIYYLFQLIGIYTNFPWIASLIGLFLSMKLLSQSSYVFVHKEYRKTEFFLIICFLFMKDFTFALLVAFHLLTYKKTAS